MCSLTRFSPICNHPPPRLSYTEFEFSQPAIHGRNVSFVVTNTGARAGAEVAQAYLTFPASAGEPPHQLRWFEKTQVLGAGESVALQFVLGDQAVSVWDADVHKWSVVAGDFSVRIGPSSQVSSLTLRFAVPQQEGLAS